MFRKEHDVKKLAGIFCLAVVVVSLCWAVCTAFLSPAAYNNYNEIQLGRISASEGTALIVKNGVPEICNSSGHFSVEKPIVCQLGMGLWFITSLAALFSGLILLRGKDNRET